MRQNDERWKRLQRNGRADFGQNSSKRATNHEKSMARHDGLLCPREKYAFRLVTDQK